MRTGFAAGRQGYVHEAVYYRSPDELLAVIVPFLRDGLAAGEPVVVALGPEHADAVRAEIPELPASAFLTGGSMYARPASAIRAYRELLAAQVAAAATQIRIIGELPDFAFQSTWDWWARYEAAINHAYDEYPLWSMCAYNELTTPAHMLDDVARTHPHVAAPDGHKSSPGFVDPASFLLAGRPSTVDPLLAGPPAVDLIDPAPSSARLAVREAALEVLPARDLDDFVVAVSEVVTNGLRHGRGPVRLRTWRGEGRVVVTVRDEGAGLSDPYAGLLPRVDNGEPGGFGLWLAHQLCDHVCFDRDDSGFTVRITAGATA